MFQLSRREDAWRLAVEWIEAVFFCRSLPGARYRLYPQRRRRPLGNRINVFSVPRDSVERACRPLRESHHRTWFTMDALLATARRPVFRPWRNALSRRTAPQLLEAPRTPQKKHCRSGIKVHHAEYPRNRRWRGGQLTELFSPTS